MDYLPYIWLLTCLWTTYFTFDYRHISWLLTCVLTTDLSIDYLLYIDYLQLADYWPVCWLLTCLLTNDLSIDYLLYIWLLTISRLLTCVLTSHAQWLCCQHTEASFVILYVGHGWHRINIGLYGQFIKPLVFDHLLKHNQNVKHQIQQIQPQQWRRGKAFTSHAWDRGLIPGCDRPKS